jgi:CRP-like cAMP-binding protein
MDSIQGVVVLAERIQNSVLADLAKSDRKVFQQLMQDLDPHPLQRGAILGSLRAHTDYAYFIESGVVSLVAHTKNGHSVEVALIGREGVAGIADALGGNALPYALIVQLPGLAYRAPKALIREHIMSCSTLHELLMDYSQRVMHQLAQSAVCNRFHTSVQRLARWLLLTAERAGTTRFELTHELLAQMVGAPRSAVSLAASTLRDKGIIDYRRGVLTIRNTARLHKVACECFDMVSLASRLPAAAAPAPLKPARKRGSSGA